MLGPTKGMAVLAAPAAESALLAAAGGWPGLARLRAAKKSATWAAEALLVADWLAERSSGRSELAPVAAPPQRSPSTQRGARHHLLHPRPGRSAATCRETAAPSPQRHSAAAAVSTDFGVRNHCCLRKPISLPQEVDRSYAVPPHGQTLSSTWPSNRSHLEAIRPRRVFQFPTCMALV